MKRIKRDVHRNRFSLGYIFIAVLSVGLISGLLYFQGIAQDEGAEKMKKIKKMQEMAPAKDYLKAHMNVDNPFGLLGGPINVEITQKSGGVFVALPDNRELDPQVFGTPKHPRAFTGTPGMTGVPEMLRESKNGQYTKMKKKSPFGDKYITMADGNLELKAVDATATDAAKSEDQLQMTASWKDKEGNTYKVKVEKLATHGLEYPTFGGVVTNVILHGFSGIGTPLMPSEYTYFAFWGMGAVMKNGEVLDKPRLVHGMLTEYVRTEDYELGFDKDVTPTRRHFHLMVAPFKPNKEDMAFQNSPVETGFTLPNGMELPFWHVMFENLDINASRKS